MCAAFFNSFDLVSSMISLSLINKIFVLFNNDLSSFGVVLIQRFIVSAIMNGFLEHCSKTFICKTGCIFAKKTQETFTSFSLIIGSKFSKTPRSVKRVSLSSPFSWYLPPHRKVAPFSILILLMFFENLEKIS